MKRLFLLIFYSVLFNNQLLSCNSDNYICVQKKNVLHTFVKFDPATDHFTQNVFPFWENETFEVFDQVKDPEGIAIDLGAWIGTTAIWLSKNFYHVIAVDADPVSLRCLALNLEASKCPNVTICNRPIDQKSHPVIFGPREGELNASISHIKEESSEVTGTSQNDSVVRTLTFKQLLHDYIFQNGSLNSRNISFIKCDIEGGEENILEDLLYFAYHNKTKVYLSFHVSWWKSKKLADFEYLFKFFKTSVPDVSSHIQANPFGSVLFEPLTLEAPLIKANIPAVIIGYNQYTYIKNMVAQLEKYTSDIIVVDNNSTYAPLLNYYEKDFKYTLLKQNVNHGHNVYTQDFVQKLVGDVYILTDPDLKFNDRLPSDFIKTLLEISQHFKAAKTGFALCIDASDIRQDITFLGLSIKEWERHFWIHKLEYPENSSLEIYSAPIDTTFCLLNRNFGFGHQIRIAGDYTCKHLPWHTNFKDQLQPGEFEAYTKPGNISTTWLKILRMFFENIWPKLPIV